METGSDKYVDEKNEKTLKQQEQKLKDLGKQLEQKEHARQELETLLNMQKDTTNKLMKEKENLENKLMQAKQQLEEKQRRIFQLTKLDELELKYIEYVEHPSERWPDFTEIVGLEDIKNTIREKILEPLKNPDKQLTKGLLFFGSPDCGESELVYATAKSAGILLFLFDSWSFSGYSHIPGLIKMLKVMQPVIVHARYSNEIGLIKTLLNEISSEDRIIVVVEVYETNIKDIDQNVLSLFPLKIEIPLPDKHRRLEIMKNNLKDYEILVSADIDWDKLSESTEGWNVRDLREICYHVKNLQSSVMMKDMEDAIKFMRDMKDRK